MIITLPFSLPGTVGKSSLDRQTSPDTCGHTQGNNPTGILFYSSPFQSSYNLWERLCPFSLIDVFPHFCLSYCFLFGT